MLQTCYASCGFRERAGVSEPIETPLGLLTEIPVTAGKYFRPRTKVLLHHQGTTRRKSVVDKVFRHDT
jgi:hypothetical protein